MRDETHETWIRFMEAWDDEVATFEGARGLPKWADIMAGDEFSGWRDEDPDIEMDHEQLGEAFAVGFAMGALAQREGFLNS